MLRLIAGQSGRCTFRGYGGAYCSCGNVGGPAATSMDGSLPNASSGLDSDATGGDSRRASACNKMEDLIIEGQSK